MPATREPPDNPLQNQTISVQKHISDWQNGAKSAKKKSKLSAREIDNIFNRFSIYWGAKWDKPFQANPELYAEEWAEALNALSTQAIKAGLQKARQEMVWPPTIAEFLLLCRGEGIQQAANHGCVIPGCVKDGTLCRSTHGSNWICLEHYREGKG